MSLRYRVVIAVVLVLVLGAGVGLALAGWQARHWLRGELTSAEASGRLAVTRTFADLDRSGQPDQDLKTLVATFDGDRHIQAVLTGADGRLLAASNPEPARPPPRWFAGLLHQEIAPVRLASPRGGAMVELRPVYTNDTAAVWPEFLDLALVLVLSCLGGATLVWAVVGRALEPLSAIGHVLPRIGAGDYAARAPERGPPELEDLARGVNEMAERLAAMRIRNRALEEQILTLQDEERADIARDLHDEMGPHLFAANVDLAMMAGLISAGRSEAALEQMGSVQAAIAHIQRLVRDILGRLRPPRLLELGLGPAILDLIEFWRQRRPEVTFETRLPPDDYSAPDPVLETAYRLVQESLSNAVRHSAPTTIAVTLEQRGAALWIEVRNDGAPGAAATPGFGLTGMIERVAATGGMLEAGPTDNGNWQVLAVLPPVAPLKVVAA
jgi:two-component system, NarL family, sensor histidine kinase UhpB